MARILVETRRPVTPAEYENLQQIRSHKRHIPPQVKNDGYNIEVGRLTLGETVKILGRNINSVTLLQDQPYSVNRVGINVSGYMHGVIFSSQETNGHTPHEQRKEQKIELQEEPLSPQQQYYAQLQQMQDPAEAIALEEALNQVCTSLNGRFQYCRGELNPWNLVTFESLVDSSVVTPNLGRLKGITPALAVCVEKYVDMTISGNGDPQKTPDIILQCGIRHVQSHFDETRALYEQLGELSNDSVSYTQNGNGYE
ncbi:hypothetical protein HY469_05190 [Candidatus Roizmanbacteria bacterium]|nr:hypothetical protein [Candidatus Roizmanbacteria bacterium]